jgi:hypothetical protein
VSVLDTGVAQLVQERNEAGDQEYDRASLAFNASVFPLHIAVSFVACRSGIGYACTILIAVSLQPLLLVAIAFTE